MTATIVLMVKEIAVALMATAMTTVAVIVKAIAARMEATMAVVAATKTMAATAIWGGKDNSQLIGAEEQTKAMAIAKATEMLFFCMMETRAPNRLHQLIRVIEPNWPF